MITNSNIQNKTAFSFEILPSLKGKNLDKMYSDIETLLEFNPKYINITSHHSEFVERTRNGCVIRQNIRKRPGSVAIASCIQNKYHVLAVPHLICAGFTKEETEYALIDLQILGVNNLLILQGDKGKLSPAFISDSHKYAIELQYQVNDFNKGLFIDGTQMDTPPQPPFSYGVAGYPEVHFEARSSESDLYFLKAKVDAGAKYVVTQMFFDNEKYFSFVERCRNIGINVPIIPGLKPIVSMRQIDLLPKVFGLSLPENLLEELVKCDSDKKVKQVGIEWAVEQSRELMKNGVPSIHFYTHNAIDSVAEIAKQIY